MPSTALRRDRTPTCPCTPTLGPLELASVEPMRRHGSAMQRLGASADACRFYDVQLLADAEHERWGSESYCQLGRVGR